MHESNKTNGITEEAKVDNVTVGHGHNLTIGGVEQQKQPPTIDVANKSLLTGQPPSSSCAPCYGFDDGDVPGILLFGKLLKKLLLIKFLMVCSI